MSRCRTFGDQEIGKALAELLSSSGLFPSGSKAHTCNLDGIKNFQDDMGAARAVLDRILAIWAPAAGGDAGRVGGLSFCGADTLVKRFQIPSLAEVKGGWSYFYDPYYGYNRWRYQRTESYSFQHFLEWPLNFFIELFDAVVSSHQAFGKLQSWDGMLSLGASATSPDRVSGDAFRPLPPKRAPVADTLHLASFSCASDVTLLGDSSWGGVRGYLPNAGRFLNQLAGTFRDLATCQYLSPDNDFEARFLPWTVDFWHSLLSNPPVTNVGENADVRQHMSHSMGLSQSTFPATCADFVSTGLCSFAMDQLPALLNTKPFSIKFTFARCADNPRGLPSVDVSCKGEGALLRLGATLWNQL